MTLSIDRGDVTAVHAASLAHLSARLEALKGRITQLIEHRGPTTDHRYRGVYVSHDDVTNLLLDKRGQVPPPDASLIERIEMAVSAADLDGQPTRLLRMARTFDLTSFDIDALLCVLAPDLDSAFEKLYGFLHDDVTRRRPSVGLALLLTGRENDDGWARSRLSRSGPLVRHGLLEVADENRPFLTRELCVPDRVCAYLLGDDTVDPALAAFVVEPVPAPVPGLHEAVGALRAGCRLIYVQETAGASGASLACTAYAELGARTLEVDVRHAPGDLGVDGFVAALVREAGLRDAALTVCGVDDLHRRDPRLLQRLTELPTVTALVGTITWDPESTRAAPYAVQAGPLPPRDSHSLLRTALGEHWPDDLDWAESGTRLRPIQVVRAANLSELRAAANGRLVTAADVHFGARQQNGVGLERLARRITPSATWSELVVGPAVEATLQQLVARVRHRGLVLDDWGLQRTSGSRRGVTAIFSGPPGTGKTMSAEVVASEMGVDLYVINLATVVDKYIGETEKNLERIFSEAEQVNGVLFFDEADAIFGKRSEVKDARDRYANVEVAYLLQRIERFDGVAILATNLKANLDEAFLRRLDLGADFPQPNHHERLTLWTQMLAPVPRCDDVDIEYLARKFELSGGYIRNIVIAAAFLAAQAGELVSMRHLVRATAQEYRKLGRLVGGSEFGEHHGLLRDER